MFKLVYICSIYVIYVYIYIYIYYIHVYVVLYNLYICFYLFYSNRSAHSAGPGTIIWTNRYPEEPWGSVSTEKSRVICQWDCENTVFCRILGSCGVHFVTKLWSRWLLGRLEGSRGPVTDRFWMCHNPWSKIWLRIVPLSPQDIDFEHFRPEAENLAKIATRKLILSISGQRPRT